MKQVLYPFIFLLLVSCGQITSEKTTKPILGTTATKNNATVNNNLIVKQKQNPIDFLPKGYIVFEKINGDLNKDGIEDCILIIKGTDKSKIIKDEYRGRLDRNRRGVIVLFNKKEYYELAVKNDNCFSSENEDGGVYIAPELSVEVKKGDLYFHYGHGRYGYWAYTFSFQNSDFELIGYNEYSNGVVNDKETSINFLTRKKREIVYINDNEIVVDTLKNIKIKSLIKLTTIKDFDELNVSTYIK